MKLLNSCRLLARRGPRDLRLALREEPLQDRESRRGDVAPLPNGGEPFRTKRPRDNEVLTLIAPRGPETLWGVPARIRLARCVGPRIG